MLQLIDLQLNMLNLVLLKYALLGWLLALARRGHTPALWPNGRYTKDFWLRIRIDQHRLFFATLLPHLPYLDVGLIKGKHELIVNVLLYTRAVAIDKALIGWVFPGLRML